MGFVSSILALGFVIERVSGNSNDANVPASEVVSQAFGNIAARSGFGLSSFISGSALSGFILLLALIACASLLIKQLFGSRQIDDSDKEPVEPPVDRLHTKFHQHQLTYIPDVVKISGEFGTSGPMCMHCKSRLGNGRDVYYCQHCNGIAFCVACATSHPVVRPSSGQIGAVDMIQTAGKNHKQNIRNRRSSSWHAWIRQKLSTPPSTPNLKEPGTLGSKIVHSSSVPQLNHMVGSHSTSNTGSPERQGSRQGRGVTFSPQAFNALALSDHGSSGYGRLHSSLPNMHASPGGGMYGRTPSHLSMRGAKQSPPSSPLSGGSATGDLSFEPHWVIKYQETKIGAELARGNFGIVYTATWRGSACVVKVAKDCDPARMRLFFREAEQMQRLRPHPNVVHLLGVCVDPDFPMCIVTEFENGGSMFELIKNTNLKIDSLLATSLLKDVAAGMSHIHSEGILHADLAARNILLARTGNNMYTAKIADFGLSHVLGGPESSYYSEDTNHFAVRWSAPEVLRNQKSFSKAADVWSFGVIIYETLERDTLPYGEMPMLELMHKVVYEGLRLKRPTVVPHPEAIDTLMALCFDDRPDRRPRFEVIHDELLDILAGIRGKQSSAEDDTYLGNVRLHLGSSKSSFDADKIGYGKTAAESGNWMLMPEDIGYSDSYPITNFTEDSVSGVFPPVVYPVFDHPTSSTCSVSSEDDKSCTLSSMKVMTSDSVEFGSTTTSVSSLASSRDLLTMATDALDLRRSLNSSSNDLSNSNEALDNSSPSSLP